MSQRKGDPVERVEDAFPRSARSGCAAFLGAVISGPITIVVWVMIDGVGSGGLDLKGLLVALPFASFFSLTLVILPSLAGTYAMMWLARESHEFASLWAWLAYGLLFGGIAAITFSNSMFGGDELGWALLVAGAITGILMRAVAKPGKEHGRGKHDA